MPTYSLARQLVYAALLFVLLLLLVPRAGYIYDMNFFVGWSTHIFEHGLGNAYQQEMNTYNPVYQYIMGIYAWMMGSPEKIAYCCHWLKGFTLLFDFMGAFWAASLVPERYRRFDLVLLLLFNIGYLYNTLIWQQIDAIYTFFCFGAVVLAAQRRPVVSLVCYVLALATKTQAIIFLPPLLLLWVPQWWQQPRQLLRAVLAGTAVAVAVLSPFIWGGDSNYLPRIIDFNFDVTNVFPVLSMNSYNLWYIVVRDQFLHTVSDTLPFAGLTYHSWGLILFLSFSVLALLPLLLLTLRQLRLPRVTRIVHTPANHNLALVLLSCGLLPLLFAFFNTQMHERYWHASILFLAAYSFVQREYVVYVLASVAYFLNLEAVLHFLQLKKYGVLLFMPWFVATLFALTIALGLMKLYRLMDWRTTWRAIWLRNATQPEPTTY